MDRIDTKLRFNRGEIHVWLASLDISSQLLGELGSTLSADEIARAERFHFGQDRRRFVSRHGILRSILAKYLETKPSALRFVANEFGKPRVEDSREACNLSFNLSHSGELALIAIAIDRDVGVDVEFIDNSVPYEEIASRFFSINEIAALEALPQSLRPARFFSCWARKEAYVKARGRGLSIPLDSFDVWSIKGGTVTSDSIEKSSDTSKWKIENIKIDSRYAAAVAAAGLDWKVAQWKWRPGIGSN